MSATFGIEPGRLAPSGLNSLLDPYPGRCPGLTCPSPWGLMERRPYFVSRSNASWYFARVFATTSGGNSGPGATRFQSLSVFR